MVSHEFRTLLTTIRASAELLGACVSDLVPEKQNDICTIFCKQWTQCRIYWKDWGSGKADAKGLDFDTVLYQPF